VRLLRRQQGDDGRQVLDRARASISAMLNTM
jgi:hypothetical protein